MGKCDFINLEDFEFWLRPWIKLKSVSNSDEFTLFSNVFELSGINEISYIESKISMA